MGRMEATAATVEVPAVGGDVQVRRIPPSLLRVMHAKATKGGELDFQELMVWKIVYGVKNPDFTEAEAREITRRYSMQTLGPILDTIDELSGTDEHLRGVDVPRQMRKFVEPVVMATAWMERFPTERPMTSRRPRARGAGRPAARRSTTSTRAGPSDDSESSEPPPRRLCAFCGKDIPANRSPKATHCSDRHADRDRQRRKRARARDWNPEVSGRDPYLRFDLEPPKRFEDLRKRIEDGCRCNGDHIADPEDGHCCKCGHRRGEALPFVGFLAAASAETRRPRKAVV